MKKERELPKGFKCGCGTEHRFASYVYAHWQDILVFTCDKCKRQYEICAGRVRKR